MSKKEEELAQAARAAAAAGGLSEPEDYGYPPYQGTPWLLGIPEPTAPPVLTPSAPEEPSLSAIRAVRAAEAQTAATQQVDAILNAWNIDPNNPDTRLWLTLMGDTPTERLTHLRQPGAVEEIQYFIGQYPDASLIRVTPYSQALEENAFAATLPVQPPSEAQMARREPGPGPRMGRGEYEYSTTTGAIRYANGTIVTADNGIIYDPSREAPGSPQWLRKVEATWSAEEIRRWKDKLVAYGYLPKNLAKGEEFTVEFLGALGTYWSNYYVNGGKPIASAEAGAGKPELPPLIDYKDFSAQITNDMRDQLRRIFGIEPTEEQVRAQTQYVMRTATDMQKVFRRKDYGSFDSQALTEATERAIGSLETSPYAEDVQENTKLADALQNAAYVTRSLMS